MEEMSCENRRMLGLTSKDERFNFANWRQIFGNFLSKSGRLQRLDENIYLEFDDKTPGVPYRIGVNVIGMEPALPIDDLCFFDYGPMSWRRFSLAVDAELDWQLLGKQFEKISKSSDFDYKRVRLVESVNWDNEKLKVNYFLDLIR